jgi:hypothetical protein
MNIDQQVAIAWRSTIVDRLLLGAFCVLVGAFCYALQNTISNIQSFLQPSPNLCGNDILILFILKIKIMYLFIKFQKPKF